MNQQMRPPKVGQKLQLFVPEGVALPLEARNGAFTLSTPSASLMWVDLHPNPLIGLTVQVAHAGLDTADANAHQMSHSGNSGSHPRGSQDTAQGEALPHRGHTPQTSSTKRDKHDPAQWPFYCDACQKGFATEETYKAHEESHMYCTVEGCRFTCRKDKAYRMDEHMELLHNRPDAPNFADMGQYLNQRRARFPTNETIQTKVAEIYYKAARGALLPDERRRWMRQHGIQIGKRPRTGQTYIAAGSLAEQNQQAEPKARKVETDNASGDHGGKLLVNSDEVTNNGTGEKRDAPSTETSSASAAPNTDVASAPLPQPPADGSARPVKRPHVIPLGPNGTLTPQQRVQLVRQRYADATEVARFYVCHRCGKKGDHWVSDCPTRGDHTFDRQVNWGEAKRERPREEMAPTDHTDPATSEAPVDGPTGHESEPRAEPVPTPAAADGANDDDDDNDDQAPPPPQSARQTMKAESTSADQSASTNAEKERTRLIAPVAAARLAAKAGAGRRMPPPTSGPQRRGAARELGLYERLTEEDRLNDMGLVLQAFRFFVSRNFFQSAQ